jgi:hypothetical protein
MNPNTDRPNHASDKPTWSFHERYGSDPEFKRQVDEARKRSADERNLTALKSSLDIANNKGPKLY